MEGVFVSPPDFRVSDAEREHAADLLKNHYEVGRLTEHELSARVDAAYRARVQSQLWALLHGLPRLEAPVPPRPLRRVRRLAIALALLVPLAFLLAAVPAELWILFVAITVPMLLMLAIMLAPFAVAGLAIAWLVRALRGPRPLRRVF